MPKLKDNPKIAGGQFYVLESLENDEKYGLLITKSELESYACASVYLFGDDNMLGEQHTFTTPKQLLSNLIEEHLDHARYFDIASLLNIQAPCKEGEGNSKYCMKFNTTSGGYTYVYGVTYMETIKKCFTFMTCQQLITIITKLMEYDIIPVYCVDNDPESLTCRRTVNHTSQIGYAVVNLDKMYEDTLYENALDVASDSVSALSFEPMYDYKMYIWDRDYSQWSLEYDGVGYEGDDILMNGILEEIGDEWLDAELIVNGFADVDDDKAETESPD